MRSNSAWHLKPAAVVAPQESLRFELSTNYTGTKALKEQKVCLKFPPQVSKFYNFSFSWSSSIAKVFWMLAFCLGRRKFGRLPIGIFIYLSCITATSIKIELSTRRWNLYLFTAYWLAVPVKLSVKRPCIVKLFGSADVFRLVKQRPRQLKLLPVNFPTIITVFLAYRLAALQKFSMKLSSQWNFE